MYPNPYARRRGATGETQAPLYTFALNMAMCPLKDIARRHLKAGTYYRQPEREDCQSQRSGSKDTNYQNVAPCGHSYPLVQQTYCLANLIQHANTRFRKSTSHLPAHMY